MQLFRQGSLLLCQTSLQVGQRSELHMMKTVASFTHPQACTYLLLHQNWGKRDITFQHHLLSFGFIDLWMWMLHLPHLLKIVLWNKVLTLMVVAQHSWIFSNVNVQGVTQCCWHCCFTQGKSFLLLPSIVTEKMAVVCKQPNYSTLLWTVALSIRQINDIKTLPSFSF